LSFYAWDSLALVADHKVINIRGVQYGAMNPTRDAIHGNGIEGDTEDLPVRDTILLFSKKGQNCIAPHLKSSIIHKA
jgi:hypothetical protein